VDLIASADAAFKSQPQNVEFGYGLSEYRWQSLSRVIDPATSQIVIHPNVVPFITRIADELSQLRRICPTYGPPYALEGELRLFVLNEPRGSELIRQAVRLASYDPTTCLVAGELAARSGRTEEAESLLNRAANSIPRAIASYRSLPVRSSSCRFSQVACRDDYERLATLAAACADSNDYANLARDLLAAAEDSLRRSGDDHRCRSRGFGAACRGGFPSRQF